MHNFARSTALLSLALLTGACTDETTDVFLEAAYFDPVRTAATGRKLGINSDARYRFARPDRNVRELHSTLVARWEYRPGSTVFAIWSHGQTTNQLTGGELALGRDLRTLVNAGSEDIVMIKVNYWIGL